MNVQNDPITYLLGSYFHQDWTDDYDTWQELIDDFVASDRAVAEETPSAIRRLLSMADEARLDDLCRRIDSSWDFGRIAGSYTHWFELLLERIENQLRLQAG